jgi:taurine--2-oxoglutarate transaminase
MEALQRKHPSVLTHRNIGLFGIVELRKNSRNEPLAPYNGSHPAVAAFSKALTQAGLYTVCRWNTFMTNPPLTITEEQLREGFAILDRCLSIVDEAYEG